PRRSRRRHEVARDPRKPRGAPPPRASAGHDRAFREGDRRPGIRDHSGGAPGRAAHGARHAEDERPGAPPQGERDPGDRPQVPGGAARRRGDPLPDLGRPYAVRHRFHLESAGDLPGKEIKAYTEIALHTRRGDGWLPADKTRLPRPEALADFEIENQNRVLPPPPPGLS